MAPRPFLFGKIPAHGDFIARGLGDAAMQVWDQWASAELAAARAALEERFDVAHDAVPPWGFVCGAGVLGEAWRAGAIAASIDTPGRRFLLVAGYDDLTAAQAAFLAARIVADCESAIRRILSEALAADAALDLLLRTAPDESDLAAAAVLDAAPKGEGVWWSLAGLTEPGAPACPMEGLVSAALSRTAELLEEAA